MYSNDKYKCHRCGSNLDPGEKCDCGNFRVQYDDASDKINYLKELILINERVVVYADGDFMYVEFANCDVYEDDNYLKRCLNLYGKGKTLNAACKDYYSKVQNKSFWWL